MTQYVCHLSMAELGKSYTMGLAEMERLEGTWLQAISIFKNILNGALDELMPDSARIAIVLLQLLTFQRKLVKYRN